MAVIAVVWCMPVGPAGANWCLRAGIGLDRPEKTTFTDRDCSSASPAALYGCGTRGDGAPYRSVGDFGTAMPLELGRGYTVSPAARLEDLVEYRPHFDFKGRANFLSPESRQSVAADLSSFAGMLAAYIDLPGPSVPASSRLSVPGSASCAPGSARPVRRFRRRRPSSRVQVRTGLAWMITAGVAAALGECVTVDLAWRYSDRGAVHTERGAGRVISRDGSREPLPLDLAETRAKLAGHGMRLSLRYAF